MMRKVKIIVTILVVVPLLLFVGYWGLLILSQGISWPPIRYELPPGYRGWIVVRFEDEKCPAMRSDGLFRVINIASGRGCTSTPAPSGWSYNRVVYVGPDGARTRVEAHFITYGEDGRRLRFFVGTQEELNRSWKDEPRSATDDKK
jgi:uncharacterized protein DUF6843